MSTSRSADAAGQGRPGLGADLVMAITACALRAGLSVSEALVIAAEADSPDGRSALARIAALVGVGVDPATAWSEAPERLAPLGHALLLAELSGAPAADIVARAAADARAERTSQAQARAARLGVLLVVPLGLAVLPGFLLLAVVPIVLGLAGSLQSGIR